MNPDKQRIAIAEACGWKRRLIGNQGIWAYYQNADPKPKYVQGGLPNYLNDLNACHEMEKTLTEKQVPFYLTKLLQVRYRTGADHGMIACMQDKLAFATAAQRAEAFLRTIGRWQDDSFPTIPATGKPITQQEMEDKE